eukprot:4044971-Prymnesium_polylepis.1
MAVGADTDAAGCGKPLRAIHTRRSPSAQCSRSRHVGVTCLTRWMDWRMGHVGGSHGGHMGAACQNTRWTEQRGSRGRVTWGS